MIDRIKLNNFKCFSEIELQLGMLNIFAGINGMGKSTTIQSLLLLKQSQQQGYTPSHVTLNGDYVSLGTGKDVLFENAEKEEISISVFEEENEYIAQIGYDSKADVLKLVHYDNDMKELFEVGFEYLNAERNAPQSIYPKSSYYIDSKSQLGINGQFTAHYLSKYQDSKVLWGMKDKDSEESLKEVVQRWLDVISPNVKLDVQEIENTDLTKLGYYYTDNEKSNIFRPTNVGFGISYVLPVIVALVKAERGSIVVIENPEAHLHPHGQRKMGELIAQCAAKGVQVYIETHSDHVLNGIRIAAKRKLIDNELISLFYFSKKEINGDIIHTVESPKVDENGKLDYWPDGFFDEWEKALDEII